MYPLFAKIDFISHNDSKSVDREMALLFSPMSMDLFRVIEPWLSHGMIHGLWISFTYSVVVNHHSQD